ncbi:HpcH/HpaI aldolase/citrate lyase family protein [Streptomyces sp. NPDC001100]
MTTALDDERALVADAERAAALGFTGKVCVHPRQVRPVNAAFTPSDEEREQARAIVRASADRAADGAVTVVNGRMVDRPVLERAPRLLNRP